MALKQTRLKCPASLDDKFLIQLKTGLKQGSPIAFQAIPASLMVLIALDETDACVTPLDQVGRCAVRPQLVCGRHPGTVVAPLVRGELDKGETQLLQSIRQTRRIVTRRREDKAYIWVIWPLGRVWAGESACPGEHSP